MTPPSPARPSPEGEREAVPFTLRTIKIKICGLTSPDESAACARAGADWIGLNFHPGSPRFISGAVAAEIIRALPPGTEPVGLFVNRPPQEVARCAEELGLRRIQLHGDEPPEDLLSLARFHLVRAFRLGAPADVTAMIEYLDRARALGRSPDSILVDAHVPGKHGGTGATVASALFRLIPPLPRLILAGGLNPSNVAARVAECRPWMVDAASGVETSPGRKDIDKVIAFIRAARTAPAGRD